MAKSNYKRAKSAYKKIKKAPAWEIVLAIILLIVVVGGYYYYENYYKKEEPFSPPVGAISFHFMTLGNNKNGDSVYIKAGDTDILIDAGSYYDSITAIEEYVDNFVTDGKLEYLIATHAHEDHIACLGGDAYGSRTVFDAYVCETIIDFPKTNSTSGVYQRYCANRDNEVSNDGATHYTALECYNNQNGAQRIYQLSESVSMEILYNYYYDHSTSNENNNSVCIMFHHGTRKFLFTGDLEDGGEEKLVEHNDLGQVTLFKAGHHGSQTASNNCLIEVIKPEIVVIPCVVGYDQYDAEFDNIFPSRRVLESIAKYTSNVYAPTIGDTAYTGGATFADLNGDIVVTSDETEVKVTCSESPILFKDTEWCKTNRSGITWKS